MKQRIYIDTSVVGGCYDTELWDTIPLTLETDINN